MEPGKRPKRKRMKKKNRFAYAKKPETTLLQALKSLSEKDSTSLKLYQDCRVPLDIFLDCCFDKDYERLCISGNASESDLLQAWEKIYVEYADLTNEGGGNELFDKTVEINYLATKIYIVDKIVKHMQVSFSSELLGILKYYGVDCAVKETDTRPERFTKLENTIARTKRWSTELDVLRKEFAELQEQHTDKVGGREAFEDALTNLSAYRKYAVLSKDLTVRQYVKSSKSMEKEYMRLALKHNV